MKISMLKKTLTFKLLQALISINEDQTYEGFCTQLQTMNDYSMYTQILSHSQLQILSHSQLPILSHSQLQILGHSRLPILGHSRLPILGHSRLPILGHSRSPP
ncbi:uncharacterized protein BDCG_07996 [Blastomyces dermatitidis ER-3]|uniref:Uncharacterized protein n=1 Tax=Ajellomyces dermatitidis (strain ER-3 / ATCC MYA-2586) TaxID=559297 RepID=A0ABP2EQS7_AJEDR|nr:uncharacterized protein BDCG_07996 [Blastomyces dermatitidis ER-3]EEQ84727.2 hypothetical protein BDCG_07996 [Blastomyces dermatitidis ER-3]